MYKTFAVLFQNKKNAWSRPKSSPNTSKWTLHPNFVPKPGCRILCNSFFSRFSCQAGLSSVSQRAAQLMIISTFQSYRRPSGQHSSLLLAQREAFHPPKLQNSLQRRTGGATPWLVQRAKIERAEHSWRTLVGWGAQVSWLWCLLSPPLVREMFRQPRWSHQSTIGQPPNVRSYRSLLGPWWGDQAWEGRPHLLLKLVMAGDSFQGALGAERLLRAEWRAASKPLVLAAAPLHLLFLLHHLSSSAQAPLPAPCLLSHPPPTPRPTGHFQQRQLGEEVVRICQIKSCLIKSCHLKKCLFKSCPIKSCLIKNCLHTSCFSLSTERLLLNWWGGDTASRRPPAAPESSPRTKRRWSPGPGWVAATAALILRQSATWISSG